MAHARRRFAETLKARTKPSEPPAQALKFLDERQARYEIPNEGELQVLRDNLDEKRIASSELLLRIEVLPHLKCSRATLAREWWDEGNKYGDASGINSCDAGAVQVSVESAEATNSGRVCGYSGLSSEARDAFAADGTIAERGRKAREAIV
jgi:hypothetical protein